MKPKRIIMDKITQREIKYKVWDKKIKKMYDVKAISFNLKQVIVFDEDQDDDLFLPFSKIELIQYTGKNCKDKECYEGDILLVWNKERTTKFYYEVVFETKNCAFSALPINDPLGFGYDYEVLPVIIKSFSGAEIVGNKFEHKHLLNKTTNEKYIYESDKNFNIK